MVCQYFVLSKWDIRIVTCLQISSVLDVINMIIFTNVLYLTHVLYHPHTSAVYKMLNPIIKITSATGTYRRGGKGSWLSESSHRAGQEQSQAGRRGQAALAPLATSQVHHEEKAENVRHESVNRDSWREFVREPLGMAFPRAEPWTIPLCKSACNIPSPAGVAGSSACGSSPCPGKAGPGFQCWFH